MMVFSKYSSYILDFFWKINRPSFSIKTGSDIDSRMSLGEELPEESTKSIWLLDADPVGGKDILIEDHVWHEEGPWSGVKSTFIVGICISTFIESMILLSSLFWDVAQISLCWLITKDSLKPWDGQSWQETISIV